jgi:hypothetical protein
VNWLVHNYQWAVAIIVMPIVGILLKRFLSPKKEQAPTTGVGLLTNSALTAGEGGTQILGNIHARDIHFGTAPVRVPPVQPSQSNRPTINVQYISASVISLEETLDGVLLVQGAFQNAIAIRFANEPRPGNIRGYVRAVLRYQQGQEELCEVSGLWLGESRNEPAFDPDGKRHMLVAGIFREGQLTAIDVRKSVARRRDWFHVDTHPLTGFQAGTLFVRLVEVSTNAVLFEGTFLLGTNPLSIALQAGTPVSCLPTAKTSTLAQITGPNLQYVVPKEKRVFISPFARDGICDPRTSEEHEHSVQALVLKFENCVLSHRRITRALNVIAKVHFQSKDKPTHHQINYGVWLNSPCNSTDIGIGDTRELVLICVDDNDLMSFDDRRTAQHSFDANFSYLELCDVGGMEMVDITLIDQNTQATLNIRLKVWREGIRFCISKV